jgi:hypothetical protein
MSVASNTFKKERKVYTKSGKPEQIIGLLSGAKVSVNSEELRFLTNNALKENTVRDIQVALGIPGKGNNLKGQGVKNIQSFDTGAGGDDSSPDDDADNASESPPGGVGQYGGSSSVGTPVSPSSPVSPFSGDINGMPTGQDDPDDNSLSGIGKGKGLGGTDSGPTGTSVAGIQSAIAQAQQDQETQTEESNKARFGTSKPPSYVKNEFGEKVNVKVDPELVEAEILAKNLEESKPNFAQSFFQDLIDNPIKSLVHGGLAIGSFGLGNVALSALTQANTISGVLGGKTIGEAAQVAANEFEDLNAPNPFSTASASKSGTDSTPSGAGNNQSAPTSSSTDPDEGTDSGTDSGGDDAFPTLNRNPRAVRAASNNVDLAIDDDDTTKLTRNQLRNARRSTTRYA